MNEIHHPEEAGVALAAFVSTPYTEAAAGRPGHARCGHHVLRLYESLIEHSEFAARASLGTRIHARNGYAVATGADRVRLPADTTFAMFSYAVGMLLSRHPRARAIGGWEHEGHIYLEPVELYDSPEAARNTGRMLDRVTRDDPGPGQPGPGRAALAARGPSAASRPLQLLVPCDPRAPRPVASSGSEPGGLPDRWNSAPRIFALPGDQPPHAGPLDRRPCLPAPRPPVRSATAAPACVMRTRERIGRRHCAGRRVRSARCGRQPSLDCTSYSRR